MFILSFIFIFFPSLEPISALDKIETLCHVDNLTIPNEVAPMQQFQDPGPTQREIAERQVRPPQYPKFHRSTITEVGKQNLGCLSLQSEFLNK